MASYSLSCLLLVSFVVLIFSSACNAAFVETVYTASLNGQQQVPLQGSPTNVGTAFCIYNRYSSPPLLDCDIQHTIQIPTNVYIQVAAIGNNGPVVYTFTTTFSTNIRQIFQMRDFVDYSLAQQEYDFLNGNWYINIQSDDYPTGDIRGQLLHTDRFYSRMNVANTIPHASATAARGVVTGVYSFNRPKRELLLDIVHDVISPTAVEIHNGTFGGVGPTLYSFSSAFSPLYVQLEYSQTEEVNVLNDFNYIIVKSQRNPLGDIRGQLISIDYIETVAFTSRLNNAQTLPLSDSTAQGCALVTFDCVNLRMEYLVFHNVYEATAAYVQGAPAGKIGSVRFPLSRPQSPIYGYKTLDSADTYLLYSRQMYFNIPSTTWTTGEIRGQITVDYDYWSYLSGTNVVPPLTTSSIGCATFSFSSNRVANYDIHHSVPYPLSTQLYQGHEGNNDGKLLVNFDSTISPIYGKDFSLDPSSMQNLVDHNLYIVVNSFEYPHGEVRGQIKRVNPCVVSNTNLPYYYGGNGGNEYNSNSHIDYNTRSFYYYSASIVQASGTVSPSATPGLNYGIYFSKYYFNQSYLNPGHNGNSTRVDANGKNSEASSFVIPSLLIAVCSVAALFFF